MPNRVHNTPHYSFLEFTNQLNRILAINLWPDQAVTRKITQMKEKIAVGDKVGMPLQKKFSNFSVLSNALWTSAWYCLILFSSLVHMTPVHQNWSGHTVFCLVQNLIHCGTCLHDQWWMIKGSSWQWNDWHNCHCKQSKLLFMTVHYMCTHICLKLCSCKTTWAKNVTVFRRKFFLSLDLISKVGHIRYLSLNLKPHNFYSSISQSTQNDNQLKFHYIS